MKLLPVLVLLYSFLAAVRFSLSGRGAKPGAQVPLVAAHVPDGPIPQRPGLLIALQPGDCLLIRLNEPAERAPEFDSDCVVVGADGTITLPGLDRPIMANALTPGQLGWFIEKIYRDNGILPEPQFSIGYWPPCVPLDLSVGGEVNSGGLEMQLVEEIRLLDAIAKAGGMTEYADTMRVKLIRGRETMIFDLSTQQQANTNNPLLKKGDVIFVPQNY